MRRFARAGVLAALLPACAGRAVCAQEKVTLRSDSCCTATTRSSATPFGRGRQFSAPPVRVAVDVEINPRVERRAGRVRQPAVWIGPGLRAGAAGDRDDGARAPLVLRLRHPAGAVASTRPAGPDRQGPHALLPPLQRETLTFDRPYEAGLQWDFDGARLGHSIWLEWQRINTSEHRERFDGGLNARLTLTSHLSVPVQVHVVHEGGQLFNTGPVADSAAGAAAIAIRRITAHAGTISLEFFGVASKSVPDRERPDQNRNGTAFFGRAAVERDGWRAHLIAWRGRNFVKDEGDANYLSIRRDGSRYRGIRDYAEAGLARRFRLAPGAMIEVSGRFHRTERHYEYSYRVLSIASLGWRLR